MLMIVAALEEELRTAMDCCRDVQRCVLVPDIPLWRARTGAGDPVVFLRVGVGPKKSSARLREALEWEPPERVLIAGYAGALVPKLRVGDLVAVTRATPFWLNEESPDWNHIETDRTFDLIAANSLTDAAAAANLPVFEGGIVSSKHILGNPTHKELLFRRFQAVVVDMETAFMVREATLRGIPTDALRVVSDTAEDDFLEAFEHDPTLKLTDRARKLFRRNPTRAWREWKTNAATARDTLRRFWQAYLK
ncbi:MAG: hypothetical protein LBP68_08485 [Acidobacteriota bacterium]|jgi:nucleoside phosphorylase|nr:hypothetical protein [Acidobacteriota bacterium]